MYTKELKDQVMNYYYNVSHSQAKTAINFKIGKTTVRQWRGDNRLICLVKMALLSDFFILRKKTEI